MAKYTPEPIPIFDDLTLFREWLAREFSRISATFDAVESIDLSTLSMPVSKPQEGMIILADGINFNPGAGAGVYAYIGSKWVKLSGLAGSQDYEAKPWTPTVTFGGGSAGMVINATGSGIRMGGFVYAGFDIDVTNKGTSVGGALIGDLPWPINVRGGSIEVGYYEGMNLPTGSAGIAGFPGGGGVTGITIRSQTVNSTISLNDSHFGNAFKLIGGIYYET